MNKINVPLDTQELSWTSLTLKVTASWLPVQLLVQHPPQVVSYPGPRGKGLGDTWRGFPCVGRLEQQFYQVATFFHVLKNLMRFVHKTGDLVCMGMLPSVTRPFSVIFARGPLWARLLQRYSAHYRCKLATLSSCANHKHKHWSVAGWINTNHTHSWGGRMQPPAAL